MVNATSASSTSSSGKQVGVPSGAALTETTNAGTGGDNGTMSTVHGVLMLLAFVILFPLGAILLRWLKNGVRAHWIVQSVALVLVVVGGGLGIALSEMSDDVGSLPYSSLLLERVLEETSTDGLGLWLL